MTPSQGRATKPKPLAKTKLSIHWTPHVVLDGLDFDADLFPALDGLHISLETDVLHVDRNKYDATAGYIGSQLTHQARVTLGEGPGMSAQLSKVAFQVLQLVVGP